MTATTIASMIIGDIDLRTQPGILKAFGDPMTCKHLWEPHLWEIGRAYCARCGSMARWINDPRVNEEAAS